MCFGDSFVAGTGDPSCCGWVGRVAASAWEAGIPLTAYNLGVRREPSTEVVARWRTEALPRLAPGADCRVAFSFGANDATLEDGRVRVDPSESVATLESALGEARAGDGAHPGAGGYAQLAELVRGPFLDWLGTTSRRR
jgi:acyl-CoA thioesterase I